MFFKAILPSLSAFSIHRLIFLLLQRTGDTIRFFPRVIDLLAALPPPFKNGNNITPYQFGQINASKISYKKLFSIINNISADVFSKIRYVD